MSTINFWRDPLLLRNWCASGQVSSIQEVSDLHLWGRDLGCKLSYLLFAEWERIPWVRGYVHDWLHNDYRMCCYFSVRSWSHLPDLGGALKRYDDHHRSVVEHFSGHNMRVVAASFAVLSDALVGRLRHNWIHFRILRWRRPSQIAIRWSQKLRIHWGGWGSAIIFWAKGTIPERSRTWWQPKILIRIRTRI